MRIHGSEGDRDYWRNYFSTCPQVFVDGCLIEHVVEADDVTGRVIVTAYDEKGKVIISPTGDSIVTRVLTGKVKIVGKLQPWARKRGLM